MSDSFADLWASSAPTKPTPQQPSKKLDSTAPPRRPQYDAFSMLSASQPPSQTVVVNQRQSRQPKTTPSSGDAFSTLFTSSLDGDTGRNSDRTHMSMAERAALAQQAKTTQILPVAQTSASSSLWEGLDTLARPATESPRPPASGQGRATAQDDFDFGFDDVSTEKNQASVETDDWELPEFGSLSSVSRSAPAPTKPSGSRPTTLWDLDEFESSEPQSRSLTGTPGDFDFGGREDGPLGEDSDVEDTFGIRGSHAPEDDILGELGRPVSQSHSPSPNPSTSTPSARPARTSASPPPHIIGQLVEMGFSPVDARAALVNTTTEIGFDVQAATELLLSQAGQDGFASTSPDSSERERRIDRDAERDRDRHARRPALSRNESSNSSQHPKSQPQPDLTAEKLLSQASEIGRGMFNRANALWKEGRERAVKMYEERTAAAGVASVAPASDGRPRWMRDHDHASSERQRPDRTDGRSTAPTGFKDDEDESEGREQKETGKQQPARRPPQPRPEREPQVDLFSTDSPTTAYQSPFRRGKPKPTVPPPSTQPSLAAIQTSSGPSTPPQPSRTFTTTITGSALASSSSHKSAGTDAFKRGDFPVALAAYIRALSALPPEHVLRVPVLTNVALVRSKLGELRESIKACEEAITIARRFVGGTSGDGTGEIDGTSFAGIESNFDDKTPLDIGSGRVSVSVQGGVSSNGDLPTSVDLSEGLSKAYRRRAEALEGLEKWETARNTWEALLGVEWAGAGVKGEAIKGVDRCRRMVDGGGAGPSVSQSKPNPNPLSRPRPKPKPTSSASSPPSAALTALRSTNDAQQTEDNARLACKDAVETRLNAWKSGKEGNIRALLTSLDETVLWPELGWRKVGMAEVVSKGQVKGAYVRAIARVHPDKLHAENTTVEQRMVANGVFGTLNEAWNAFQQQQQ